MRLCLKKNSIEDDKHTFKTRELFLKHKNQNQRRKEFWIFTQISET